MNIIAIDPSLISTALVVSNGDSFKMYNYCRESDAVGKKGLTKWFKFAEEFINYRFIEYREFSDYSEGELVKLKDYDRITDMIIDDILLNIDLSEETKIGIEGYSYSSDVGSIIDLVTFSTILRKKLYDKISTNIVVLSPSSLKLESCKLTYNPIVKEIGGKNPRKEYIWKNNIGLAGGNFTKFDIYYSIIENSKLDDYWFKHCVIMRGDITSVSKVNKPYEDINDAYILYNVIKCGMV